MFSSKSIQIVRYCLGYLPRVASNPNRLSRFRALPFMEKMSNDSYANGSSSSFSSYAQSSSSGGRGRGRGFEVKNDGERPRGRGRGGRGGGGGGGTGNDKIDALGRLLTRILRHMASELKLNMRNDGYVKVADLLKLDMKTFVNIPLRLHTVDEVRELNMRNDGYVKVADLLKLDIKTFVNIPLRLHTVDEVRESVRTDNKQRFNLLEENGELLIRANQGHSLKTVESEKLLKPVLSAEEVPVCIHGTYKKNLESILNSGLERMERLHVHFTCSLPTNGEVISGIRHNVNVIIFIDVRKALEDGMKFYMSDNMVILTEGFDGVVPVKYFQKIESWPKRKPIPF